MHPEPRVSGGQVSNSFRPARLDNQSSDAGRAHPSKHTTSLTERRSPYGHACPDMRVRLR